MKSRFIGSFIGSYVSIIIIARFSCNFSCTVFNVSECSAIDSIFNPLKMAIVLFNQGNKKKVPGGDLKFTA